MASLVLHSKTRAVLYLCVWYIRTIISQEPIVCEHGFYMNEKDGNVTCNPCNECTSGIEVAKCSNQSDTVCKSCDPGTFYSGNSKCQPCSHCPPGTYLAGYCSKTSDTQCEPCQEGTFSSQRSQRRCRPCGTCGRHLVVESNCSKTADVRCGDCVQGYFKHPHTPTCIKCSYCYPDRPNATAIVNECITKSDVPDMRCMPIPGLVGFAGSDDGSMIGVATTSTVMWQPSSHADGFIPVQFSVPIIVVCLFVILLVVITIAMFSYRRHMKTQCTSCKSCHTKKSTDDVVMVSGNDASTSATRSQIRETIFKEEACESSTPPPLEASIVTVRPSKEKYRRELLRRTVDIIQPKKRGEENGITEKVKTNISFLKCLFGFTPKAKRQDSNIEAIQTAEKAMPCTCAENEAYRSDDEVTATSTLLKEGPCTDVDVTSGSRLTSSNMTAVPDNDAVESTTFTTLTVSNSLRDVDNVNVTFIGEPRRMPYGTPVKTDVVVAEVTSFRQNQTDDDCRSSDEETNTTNAAKPNIASNQIQHPTDNDSDSRSTDEEKNATTAANANTASNHDNRNLFNDVELDDENRPPSGNTLDRRKDVYPTDGEVSVLLEEFTDLL